MAHNKKNVSWGLRTFSPPISPPCISNEFGKTWQCQNLSVKIRAPQDCLPQNRPSQALLPPTLDTSSVQNRYLLSCIFPPQKLHRINGAYTIKTLMKSWSMRKAVQREITSLPKDHLESQTIIIISSFKNSH